MAYQLSTLVPKVQDRLQDSSFSSSLITQFLNDAQRELLNGKYLPFMEASQTYTVAVGVADLTNGVGLPTNYQSALYVRNTTSGNRGAIPYITYQDFLETYPDAAGASNGVPAMWYLYAGTINLYPKPASAYTFALDYVKAPSELTADADVPSIPEAFQEVLILGAYKRGLEFNDDFDQAAVVQTKIDELVEQMVVRLAPKQAGAVRTIRPNKRSRNSFFGS